MKTRTIKTIIDQLPKEYFIAHNWTHNGQLTSDTHRTLLTEEIDFSDDETKWTETFTIFFDIKFRTETIVSDKGFKEIIVRVDSILLDRIHSSNPSRNTDSYKLRMRIMKYLRTELDIKCYIDSFGLN